MFERRPNHFPAIEEEVETFHALLDPGEDLLGALKGWLKRAVGPVPSTCPASSCPATVVTTPPSPAIFRNRLLHVSATRMALLPSTATP